MTRQSMLGDRNDILIVRWRASMHGRGMASEATPLFERRTTAGDDGSRRQLNSMTLRTILPAFMLAKPSLISDSLMRAETQSSRCSLPFR